MTKKQVEELVIEINNKPTTDIPAIVGECARCGKPIVLYADEPTGYCSAECLFLAQCDDEE